MDWIGSTAPGAGRRGPRAGGSDDAAPARGRLSETMSFGPNPGALRMLSYAPKSLKPGAPLIVVLHGCSQTAGGYDLHAGWTTLADSLGFAVLYPEQRKANNSGGCFNWFLSADVARGLGEARSIREMIETLAIQRRTDRSRIFVVGLSAGGAMAACLLANYPDVFAAGAIIAGLPCGLATNMQEAFEQMARPSERAASDLGDAVRTKSPHEGPWPRISIWHGSADSTVSPRNADQLVRQWLDVHSAPAASFREEFFDGHRRRVWSAGGREVVESITIAGMGHGTPVDGRAGERKGPFMLETGVSSTRRIAAFFGLGEVAEQAARKPAAMEGEILGPHDAPRERPRETPGPKPADRAAFRDRRRAEPPAGRGVQAVIEKALRAAGLMR